MKEKVMSIVQEILPEVIRNRRYFRQHPEPSREEFNTQKYILEELKALGIEGKACFNTGIIADIKGSLPGNVVALRADMDALRLTDESGLPFASQNEGICHGCGHDGHMSVLLGAARVFSALNGDFPGTIRLLFQPSEEMPDGGAKYMIQEGALDGVDYVLGNHIWQPQASGTIGVVDGPIMASVSRFEIEIQGHGGHGSMPDTAISAATIASDIVGSINEIVGNNVPSLERASLSIGMLHSGTAFNIIPDKASITGSIRTFDDTILDTIERRLKAITKGACQKYEASGEAKVIRIFPTTINNPKTTAVLREVAGEILGTDKVETVIPTMASEDFSYFQQKVPGTYFFLGTGNETCCYPHHHPKFQINEDVLANGVAVMTCTALRLATLEK